MQGQMQGQLWVSCGSTVGQLWGEVYQRILLIGAAFILRFKHILLQQRLRNLETCAYYLVALNQVAPVFLDLLATPLHAVDSLFDDSRWQSQSRLTQASQVFGLALLLPVVKCFLQDRSYLNKAIQRYYTNVLHLIKYSSANSQTTYLDALGPKEASC